MIATGDLTHRNRPEEQSRAAALLRSLERPLVVIPGNHDIPPWSPRRFTRHVRRRSSTEWPELEPVYHSDRLVVCGLNSVRPWKHQGGALGKEQLERIARVLAEAPPGALRVVALHHHLVGAPWRSHKRPSPAAPRCWARSSTPGAELVLSGHVHQSAVGERREFEVVEGPVHGTTVVTAPGLGPAAAAPARRGPRPPPLRGGRALAAGAHVSRGRSTAGPRSPTAASRAEPSRSARSAERLGSADRPTERDRPGRPPRRRRSGPGSPG